MRRRPPSGKSPGSYARTHLISTRSTGPMLAHWLPDCRQFPMDVLQVLHPWSAVCLCRTFQIPFVRRAAFADNLEFLREILKTLHKYAPVHPLLCPATCSSSFSLEIRQAVMQAAQGPACSRKQRCRCISRAFDVGLSVKLIAHPSHVTHSVMQGPQDSGLHPG